MGVGVGGTISLTLHEAGCSESFLKEENGDGAFEVDS